MGYAEFHYELKGKSYVTRIYPQSEGSSMHTQEVGGNWTSDIAPGPSLAATLAEITEIVEAELATG